MNPLSTPTFLSYIVKYVNLLILFKSFEEILKYIPIVKQFGVKKMGRKNINIFGVKFALPKGLRLSPGANSHALCVGEALRGKKHTSRNAVKIAFSKASKDCKGK